jgi:hypothetical protein
VLTTSIADDWVSRFLLGILAANSYPVVSPRAIVNLVPVDYTAGWWYKGRESDDVVTDLFIYQP